MWCSGLKLRRKLNNVLETDQKHRATDLRIRFSRQRGRRAVRWCSARRVRCQDIIGLGGLGSRNMISSTEFVTSWPTWSVVATRVDVHPPSLPGLPALAALVVRAIPCSLDSSLVVKVALSLIVPFHFVYLASARGDLKILNQTALPARHLLLSMRGED